MNEFKGVFSYQEHPHVLMVLSGSTAVSSNFASGTAEPQALGRTCISRQD